MNHRGYDKENVMEENVMHEEAQIEITIGFATQLHWIAVDRVYYVGTNVVYATRLFSFWEHPFYKQGGVGHIPLEWTYSHRLRMWYISHIWWPLQRAKAKILKMLGL